jgi:hypothetical protein
LDLTVEATADIENCTIKSFVLFTKYFSVINVINKEDEVGRASNMLD